MHVPSLAEEGGAVSAAAFRYHEGGAIVGSQRRGDGGHGDIAQAVNRIDEVGEAIVDDQLSQREIGGVGDALQLLHEIGGVGLMLGDAGFGQGDDSVSRQLAPGPFGRPAEADALFGEEANFVAEALAVGIAHVVGRAT